MGWEGLSEFFKRAHSDRRIGIAHIGLYAVLFEVWSRTDFRGPIKVYSYEVKPVAKLFSKKTYLRLLRDLHNYGYLHYEPSRYSGEGSTIVLKVG